jgi:hypothetical protein
MTKSTISNWTLWYVDKLNNKVTCRICGNSFIKKNVKMLSHLGNANMNGQKDIGVELCKNIKPEMEGAFQRCGSVASILQEPTESY